MSFPLPESVAQLLADSEKSAGRVTVGEHGGAQSDVGDLTPDLIPAEALLAIASVAGHGAKKYARNNWRKIPMHEHIRHALIHLFKIMAGDTTEPHLWHALTRLAFAVATEVPYDFREFEPLTAAASEG